MASRTPMASATAPPTPVSISSNTSVGAEPRSASTTLSASRKRASSPPEATFISGPGRVPGLVCTQNSTRSMPFGPAAAASLSIWVENCARSSLSGLSSPLTALSSAACGLGARFRQRVGGFAVIGLGGARRRLQRLELLLAGVDQRDIGPVAGGERGQLVHRRIVFAACRAQREQPLLDALELGRIEVGGAQRGFEMAAGVVQRAERGIERLHRRLDQLRRLRLAPLQAADDAGQRRNGGIGAGDHLMGVAQILGHLFGLHHDGAPLGERRLLAGLRAQSIEFLDGMAQPVAFALGARDLFAVGAGCFFRGAARLPQRGDPGGIGFQAAEGVEQAAVGAGVDQRALVVLAVDLDQRLAQLLHHLHAHRLIVDESAGAPVGELHAAQDQVVLGRDVVGLSRMARAG